MLPQIKSCSVRSWSYNWGRSRYNQIWGLGRQWIQVNIGEKWLKSGKYDKRMSIYRLGTYTGKPLEGVLGTGLWIHVMQRGMAIPEHTVIVLLDCVPKEKRLFSPYFLYHIVILKLILIIQNPWMLWLKKTTIRLETPLQTTLNSNLLPLPRQQAESAELKLILFCVLPKCNVYWVIPRPGFFCLFIGKSWKWE